MKDKPKYSSSPEGKFINHREKLNLKTEETLMLYAKEFPSFNQEIKPITSPYMQGDLKRIFVEKENK